MSDNSAPRGASITLRKLTKHFGEAVAVDSIDLEARAGEFLTFLGPSGSGKTTTLNMIAGFEPVTSGDLLINDEPVQSLPPYKRDIGMVFQHYALFPHMSVTHNVEYPLRQRKIAKADRTRLVNRALETVGLESLGQRYPRQLSGGQQQRVALARAMVYDPRVLLMDEPLGALDKKLRDVLQLEIKRIHAELGTTFVYVTHDQDEALVLSDRIAVFKDGRIEQIGTARELYEGPATLFVAQFLGESSLFRGSVTRDGQGWRVDTADGPIVGSRGSTDAADATVVVRPERIIVHMDRPSGPNVVPGRVVQEIYLGAARKIEVTLRDGRTVLVREGAAEITDAGINDEVWLQFRPEDAVVLPSPSTPGDVGSADVPLVDAKEGVAT